jgi:hypothetical protein
VSGADYRPTEAHRTQVEAMAGYGIPEADIAGVLEIDVDTLRRHFPRELKSAHVKANARVAENLFRKATGDGREAVVAAIFWLKTRAGWKETAVHEVSGRDGAPIAVERPSALEELQRRLEQIRERSGFEGRTAEATERATQ